MRCQADDEPEVHASQHHGIQQLIQLILYKLDTIIPYIVLIAWFMYQVYLFHGTYPYLIAVNGPMKSIESIYIPVVLQPCVTHRLVYCRPASFA